MNREIRKLVNSQSKDLSYNRVTPQIINPTKQRPFADILSCKKRLVFYGYLAGESNQKISRALKVHRDTVSAWLSECLDIYPEYRK